MGRFSADKFIEDAKASMLPPGDDPLGHVAHTLSAFPNAADDEYVVMATSGVYGDDVRTGMTWGDLRAVYNMAAPPAVDQAPDAAGG